MKQKNFIQQAWYDFGWGFHYAYSYPKEQGGKKETIFTPIWKIICFIAYLKNCLFPPKLTEEEQDAADWKRNRY